MCKKDNAIPHGSGEGKLENAKLPILPCPGELSENERVIKLR